MTILACMLEEPSAREMLKAVLPRILPDAIEVRYLIFEGKQDLEKHLEKRLRGWNVPDTCFLILRDQDSGDCHTIKDHLTELCRKSGKSAWLVRIACRELESFYLGGLAAVEKGLQLSGFAQMQMKEKYRDPDRLGSPSRELSRLTAGCYQKIAGSRAIAPQLRLDENRSKSFNTLVTGIRILMRLEQNMCRVEHQPVRKHGDVMG